MVYIVLIVYNGWYDTLTCVESIFLSNYTNFKIVIIDNKSDKNLGDKEVLVKKFSKIVATVKVKNNKYFFDDSIDKAQIWIINNDENNGFAAGVNCAFRFIKEQKNIKYIWLLGNDNVIKYDALNNLVMYMKENNQTGICGSISLSYYDKEKIQCAGVGIYNKWTGRSKHLLVDRNICDINKNKIYEALNKNNKYELYIYGNSMFFSKEFFDKMSNLPENYFIYYEELEIMQQLKSLNMKYGVAVNSIVYHKEGSSTGGNKNSMSCIADYYAIRNRILYTLKYHKICIVTIYMGICVTILKRIWKRQFNRIPMILKIIVNPYPKFNERY